MENKWKWAAGEKVSQPTHWGVREHSRSESGKKEKDQMARVRITSYSGFHSVSQTGIQTGCSCELTKLFTLQKSVFTKESWLRHSSWLLLVQRKRGSQFCCKYIFVKDILKTLSVCKCYRRAFPPVIGVLCDWCWHVLLLVVLHSIQIIC